MDRFECVCKEILQECSEHHSDRDVLISTYVKKRLDDSLNVYNMELNNILMHISKLNSLRVLKKISKGE